jgi:acetate---CoA ligase (ADP-forming)
VELRLGVETDANFGPVIACGAGGVAGDLLRDVAIRLTPVSASGAREMIRSLRTFPLLDGYRGAEPTDVASLEEVILRLSSIVEHHREISAVSCDPAHVSADGTVIGAAGVRVHAAPPTAPMPSLSAF